MSGSFSRRAFGLCGLAYGFVGSAYARADEDTPAPDAQDTTASAPAEHILCYVGGYTQHGPPGGNGDGITVFEMDQKTGQLHHLNTFTDIASPSFIAFSPDKRFLYAVNEINDFEGKTPGPLQLSR